jgi:hypothetical protein
MNGAKYRELLIENLLQRAQDLRPSPEGSPSNRTMTLSTAKTTQVCLQDKSLNVLE